MIDVKQKIHTDLVALYYLAYENDLHEICGALGNVEHLVWELRRKEDPKPSLTATLKDNVVINNFLNGSTA